MRNKNCLICKKKKFIPAFPFNTNFNEKFFYYQKCVNCNFVRIFPNPNEKDFKKLYDDQNYHKKFYSNIDTKEYIDSVKYIQKFMKSKKKILDFGFGNGNFIKEVKKIHKCYGVEYNPETIKRLKKKFKKTVFLDNKKIKDKKYINYFDIIHLGDVLEHVEDPNKLLIDLHKKIKKNGLLYIEGPIERNLSLVNILIIVFGNIKRFINPNKINSFKPYHLFFCNFQNQLRMISNLRKYTVLDYKIYESGWPYLSGGYLKKIIALVAILFSKLNIFGFKIGNRFKIILKKND